MFEVLKVNVLLFVGIVFFVNGQTDEFPGPYCAAREGGCCKNRTDDCSVPIQGTLCYCDEFCNEFINGDCCPDYKSFCLGIEPPPDEIAIKCVHNGHIFEESEQIRDNCNSCTCKTDGIAECEQDTCLIDNSIVQNVNSISDQLGWRAANYSEFWGRKYAEGLELRLGTKEPTYKVKTMSKISNKPESLPLSFNAMHEQKWGTSLTPIHDQGWCGSSWAISTASVASDRFGIHTKGKEIVNLSPQQLLSCVGKQSGCSGGHLDFAWNYIRRTGLVDEDCFPYTGKMEYCKVSRSDKKLSSVGCRLPTNVPRDHLYRVGPAYSLNNESDIMVEIWESGPVQATMRVYRDFFTYRSGIYRHSAANRAERSGFHSVRLVGWGEERNGYELTKYWIAANSWGSWWGENGFFRILRGANECEIENYVLATWPHVHVTPKKSPQRPF